jgi:hypothetical protein
MAVAALDAAYPDPRVPVSARRPSRQTRRRHRRRHDDLLVTVVCSACNHAVSVASVYATFGNSVRRIYGSDEVIGVAKGGGHDAVARGWQIFETAWGARNGLIWFDTPWGREQSVCCSPYRMQTFLRWAGHGWRTVARHRVRPDQDPLVRDGYPAP